MKNKPATRRAFVALVPAAFLLAVPGHAQEVQSATPPAPPVQQAIVPPPVVPTITPPAATVAPAPVAEPVATAAPEVEAPPPPAATRTATTRTQARSTRVVRAPAPVRAAQAPVAAAPAPAPVPAPVDVTPAPVAAAPVEATTPAPAAETAVTQTATTQQSLAIWPWVLGGLAVLMGAIALVMMRRRRADDEDVYYEEPYVEAGAVEASPIRAEPAPFAPVQEPQFLRPAAAAAVEEVPAPVAAEDATLVKPEAEEVASLTEADAPVADRPWLEMSLRPVRAGTNVDEALVEIELTVGNAGSVAAKDVRISTFMFASEPVNGSEMERMLIERGEDGVSPVTIKPGEGTRIDATLALSKAALIESSNGSILPIIVADARYTLADGSEGRTSASFTIGVSEDGAPAMSPIKLTERAMHDEVEARLHGVPEHA